MNRSETGNRDATPKNEFAVETGVGWLAGGRVTKNLSTLRLQDVTHSYFYSVIIILSKVIRL